MGAYQLKNEELTLTVISAGAEMKSLKDNKTEQEYLWQADPKSVSYTHLHDRKSKNQ